MGKVGSTLLTKDDRIKEQRRVMTGRDTGGKVNESEPLPLVDSLFFSFLDYPSVNSDQKSLRRTDFLVSMSVFTSSDLF